MGYLWEGSCHPEDTPTGGLTECIYFPAATLHSQSTVPRATAQGGVEISQPAQAQAIRGRDAA